MYKLHLNIFAENKLLASGTYSFGADITFSQALESLYGTHEGIAQAEADYKLDDNFFNEHIFETAEKLDGTAEIIWFRFKNQLLCYQFQLHCGLNSQ